MLQDRAARIARRAGRGSALTIRVAATMPIGCRVPLLVGVGGKEVVSDQLSGGKKRRQTCCAVLATKPNATGKGA